VSKIVVIGAGVAGATSAALLAKAGHHVTLLEAHVYPGGCAGTFYHQKYLFDAGATLAGGFHRGGPHDVVGKLLDIDWKIAPAEPAWRVHLPDRAITRFGEQQHWHEELATVFHDSANRDKILAFFKHSEHISDAVWAFAARQPTWPPANLADLFRTARALRPDTLRTLPLLLETMGAWAARSGMTDRAALMFLDSQLLISAQTTAQNASALFGAAAADLPRKGVNHVIGGIGTLSKQLVEAFERNGGAMHYRQEVTKLETHAGRIVAAHTNKGERFECDYLIANLTPWDLARLLGDSASMPLQTEARTRPDEFGAFTLYLGLQDDPALHGAAEHHQVIADYDRPLGETNSIFLSLSMPGDTTRAPIGHRALTISTHTRAADWWALRERADGKVEYDERAQRYAEIMLTHAERALPGLRSRIRLQLEGTPITFKFYTRRHRGGVGGFPFTSISWPKHCRCDHGCTTRGR
jgi:C-3',4' desaturase CrtD